jgi:hypothetical protein
MNPARRRTIWFTCLILGLCAAPFVLPWIVRRAHYAKLWKVVESDILVRNGELSSEAREHLRRLAADARSKLQQCAGAALNETLPRLQHPDPEVQAFALELLASWRLPQAEPHVRAYVDRTTNETLRAKAIQALQDASRGAAGPSAPKAKPSP